MPSRTEHTGNVARIPEIILQKIGVAHSQRSTDEVPERLVRAIHPKLREGDVLPVLANASVIGPVTSARRRLWPTRRMMWNPRSGQARAKAAQRPCVQVTVNGRPKISLSRWAVNPCSRSPAYTMVPGEGLLPATFA